MIHGWGADAAGAGPRRCSRTVFSRRPSRCRSVTIPSRFTSSAKRHRFHAASHGIFILKTGRGRVGIHHDRPRRRMGLQKPLQQVPVVVQVDRHDLQPVRTIVARGLLDLFHVLQPVLVPGRPEAQQHVLATIRLPVEDGAVEQHAVQLQRLADQTESTMRQVDRPLHILGGLRVRLSLVVLQDQVVCLARCGGMAGEFQ